MKQPRFWNKAGGISTLLAPASWLYTYLSDRRWKGGAHVKMSVPVICVGNINLGGTGKTPTAICLIERLHEMGRTPHLVTRGYKGSLQGPVQVDLTIHTADEVGDEPLLLAAFAPTHVAKDRAAGARAAVAAGADVIVLDDGMQNPSVHKDLTIMVVDADAGFGNGAIFPAGPLRESLNAGLAKAQIIVAIGQAEKVVKLQSQITSRPVLHGSIEILQMGMDWQGMRVLAFAGIGRPKKFFDSLSSAGADVMQTRSFGDHQKLPNSLLARLEAEAAGLDAQLVTTEKDAARLPKAWQQKVLTLPVRLRLTDRKPLDALLDKLFSA